MLPTIYAISVNHEARPDEVTQYYSVLLVLSRHTSEVKKPCIVSRSVLLNRAFLKSMLVDHV